jgi:hypothetical protein
MKVKEKFRIEEQEILLASLDHYSDAIKRIKCSITREEKSKFDPELRNISDVRTKLILEMFPIKIYNDKVEKKYISKDWYSPCYLCGESTRITFPIAPIIKGNCVCQNCFKKYSPGLYEKTNDTNKKYQEKEDKFWEKKLAKEKSKSKELEESSSLEEDLPF